MSEKKTFHKAANHSVMPDSRQRISALRSKILLILILVIFSLSNWGGGLTTAASAVNTSSSDVEESLSHKISVNNFDADRITDYAVVREESIPETGLTQLVWYILRSSDQAPSYKWFGLQGDKLVSADYDGDGMTDAAVFRQGAWCIEKSSDNTTMWAQLGEAEDQPVPADYDGDGKTDIAVYRPPSKTWVVIQSSTTQPLAYSFDCDECIEITGGNYVPVPADYFGDGTADMALIQNDWSARSRKLIVKNLSPFSRPQLMVRTLDFPDNLFANGFIGDGRDIPIPIRLNRDAQPDLAVVHSDGNVLRWVIFLNVGNSQQPSLTPNAIIPWGLCGDYLVPGDYDGNGYGDLSVWRREEGIGNYYVRPTLNEALEGGQMRVYQWGLSTDTPTALGGVRACWN
ncbi:MAG TPA: VCBS repeat-containing protein [Blastocatellia bacterium]|nr:VCBS repeat-containing protein [Blastocatellia bacterium]